MSGFQIRSTGPLSHFRAFRTVRLKDDRGISFQLTVPAHVSNEQISDSGYKLEHFLIMHAGSVAEVVYQPTSVASIGSGFTDQPSRTPPPPTSSSG